MGFGAHDPKHGARLGRQLELGPSGLLRQIVDRGPAGRPGVEGCFVGSPSAFPEPAPVSAGSARRERVLVQRTSDGGPAAGELREGLARPAEANPSRSKGGRPGLGEPWKALKISRAAYFRRKAAGELG